MTSCTISGQDEIITVNRDAWEELNSNLTSFELCAVSKQSLIDWLVNMEKKYGNK